MTWQVLSVQAAGKGISMVRPGHGLLFPMLPSLASSRRSNVNDRADHHDPTGPRKNASPIAARTTPLASPSRTSHALARVSSITADLRRDATSPTATRTPAIPIPKASTTITPVPSRPSAVERTTRPTASQQGRVHPRFPGRPDWRARDRRARRLLDAGAPQRSPDIGRSSRTHRPRSRTPRPGPGFDEGTRRGWHLSTRGRRRSEERSRCAHKVVSKPSKAGWYQRASSPSAIAETSVLPWPGWIAGSIAPKLAAINTRPSHEAGGAAIEQARKLAGARKDIRTACLAGLDRDRVVFSIAPRVTQRWAAKGDFDLFGSSFLQVGQLPDGANRDVGEIRGQIVAFDHNAIATPDRQSAGPFARDVVGIVNLQAASIGQHCLKMEREARVFFHGDLETSRLKRHRVAVASNQESLGVKRARDLAVARNQPERSPPGNDPTSVRRSWVRVSSERLTSYSITSFPGTRVAWADRSTR